MNSEEQNPESEKIPKIQKLFDRPFLWLILGFVTMAAFYTLWGMWEIAYLPQATLP